MGIAVLQSWLMYSTLHAPQQFECLSYSSYENKLITDFTELLQRNKVQIYLTLI